MSLFGRMTVRPRRRSATRQYPASPAFSVPPDCAPWVLTDIWPAELAANLAVVAAETATLAEYLNFDLRRIVTVANDKLQAISRSELAGTARHTAETRVISEARAFAVARVESTVRQLRSTPPPPPADPVVREAVGEPAVPAQPVGPCEPAEPASAEQRLRRLLACVARQEPRLRWAIGSRDGGGTVLVTDLAHGWVPPGLELPAEVRLLPPGRLAGDTAALLGATTHSASYVPGDRLTWAAEFDPTEFSVQPRELPRIDDLGAALAAATDRRAGLAPVVHAVAEAGAEGTVVTESEIDLLRVHLDTARYQLLAQYPDIDAALLRNCMLLAAIAAATTGDVVSANYHYAWFQAVGVPGSE